MSESHYWPRSGEIGTYDLETVVGNSFDWEWTGTEWLVPENKTVHRTTDQLKKMGYLGVRREQSAEPEQVDYYWPCEDENGWHTVRHRDDGIKARFWNGTDWGLSPDADGRVTTQEMIERGYLGVKKPADAKQVPSGVQSRTDETCYWPDVPGKYTVLYRTGYGNVEAQDVERTASGWIVVCGTKPATNDEMERHGFIGVQKPTVAVNVPDNAAIAAQALAELRLCRKPFQTERWAYEWGPKLCAILGAE